jgi:hypothetical protein
MALDRWLGWSALVLGALLIAQIVLLFAPLRLEAAAPWNWSWPAIWALHAAVIVGLIVWRARGG